MLCNACKLGHPGGGVYVERVRVRFLHGKRPSVCLQVVLRAVEQTTDTNVNPIDLTRPWSNGEWNEWARRDE